MNEFAKQRIFILSKAIQFLTFFVVDLLAIVVVNKFTLWNAIGLYCSQFGKMSMDSTNLYS
ncbi:hypothetical protein A374_09199 [Fictibacillus macauensis ZFHKF-1]|uniref:Uncharacterized protein n=1 Tax=Fictibacillus macauensis ZFHKF-1 TaxID=1196324 RepID=I8J2N5_9BACL|nr:hypothetical protein A374_09199 [Fictibacillus macauensis ZFHKF-1]